MLQAWLQDNNSTNWSIGISFVQYQKNSSFHRTIKRTPYKALFEVDPQIGLLSQVPADLLNKLRTEEDPEKILNQQQCCSSATPAHNDELPVDYVNLQQPSCSWASQPSYASAAPEPIETCDRDLPVESVNLQQSASE
ncbi:unnamed protein product [Parnassius apollo]|uniref:(apollo) hypothetical protein n=1 Tax=Parnassius apollo TaxID=110799 RepID=A0A8S3XN13_PARAO|nr:unnamed protein product [Parnassius apollo]